MLNCTDCQSGKDLCLECLNKIRAPDLFKAYDDGAKRLLPKTFSMKGTISAVKKVTLEYIS